MSAGFAIQDRYQTKADGSYRLVGLPGRAIVGVVSYDKKPYLQGAGSESIKGMDQNGHFPTYRNPIDPGKHWPTSMKEINPPEGTEAVHLDLALVPGAKVRVRVVDRAGKPVTGLSLAGRTQRGNHEWNVKHEAEFDVVTLAPGEDRMVLVIQEERKLGKAFRVKPGDDKKGPVRSTLEPLATIAGRVTDADGNPVSGATIRTDPLPGGDFGLSLASRIASDGKGKFVVPNVPTGCNYSIAVERGSGQRIIELPSSRTLRCGPARPPTSARSGSRTIERTDLGPCRGARTHEPIAVASLSPEPERSVERVPSMDASPPGRLRRDLERIAARPGRWPRSRREPRAGRDMPHRGHPRRIRIDRRSPRRCRRQRRPSPPGLVAIPDALHARPARGRIRHARGAVAGPVAVTGDR